LFKPRKDEVMDEQDTNGQTGGGQGYTSQTQPTPKVGQPSQGQQQTQTQPPRDEQSQGQQPAAQSHEQPEGVIPKAAEMAEKAVETGLEKTSEIVGNAIDTVADAAISALGGRPKKGNNPQGQEDATDGKPSY
jgi:hypothetical protein